MDLDYGAFGALLENNMETIELRNGSTLIDAVVYEAGQDRFSTAPWTSVAGPGIWMNHLSVNTVLPGTVATSLARYVDGRNTNNNGRDFGMRPITPGTSNNPNAVMTSYAPPDVDAQADGAAVAGLAGNFKAARVITPGVVSGINPNAIPAPNHGVQKAIIAWDESGGGNAVVSEQIFTNGTALFRIQAYLDTNDLPEQPLIPGVEETFFGLLGTIGSFVDLADVSGAVGLGTATRGLIGNTGIAWYYEKVGVPIGGGAVSEKLYLIDANDGGSSNAFGTAPFDYNVLATIDLSNSPSGWHDLAITVDALGNGVGSFDGQSFIFTTAADLAGGFYVGYRERVEGVLAFLRPATFAMVNANTVPADLDHDGDVDGDDLTLLASCQTRDRVPHSGRALCQAADLDDDNDVDPNDFGIYQRCFSGPNVPANPNCAM